MSPALYVHPTTNPAAIGISVSVGEIWNTLTDRIYPLGAKIIRVDSSTRKHMTVEFNSQKACEMRTDGVVRLVQAELGISRKDTLKSGFVWVAE